ncbi:MAG: HIT family protein [Candidatus Sungbacteria bacterium]|nr:HIT family protein [Candidatus Sungbacteria bacterium]
MQTQLPLPRKGSLIYQDNKLYACLASFPIARGHTVVVWKGNVADLHLLSRKDYEYLMDRVDDVRSAMMKALGVKKVYLLYMDEVDHVHWHLVPRLNEKGFNVLHHKPTKLKDVSLAEEIRNKLRVQL